MISSRGRDLEDYRRAAIDVCIQLALTPIAMEFFEAMGQGATEGSKRKLREADVYVGISAHRSGHIEDGYDRGVTEVEFDYADELGLERLCFIAEPSFLTSGRIGCRTRELLRGAAPRSQGRPAIFHRPLDATRYTLIDVAVSRFSAARFRRAKLAGLSTTNTVAPTTSWLSQSGGGGNRTRARFPPGWRSFGNVLDGLLRSRPIRRER
jgi:hypothetical protein